MLFSDVLSFYKEELKGETINFISTQANVLQRPKIEVLVQLADDLFACHNRILNILSHDGSDESRMARAWYEEFARGCFYFHTWPLLAALLDAAAFPRACAGKTEASSRLASLLNAACTSVQSFEPRSLAILQGSDLKITTPFLRSASSDADHTLLDLLPRLDLRSPACPTWPQDLD